ncbi:g1434 [Coccomyxa viridis]|uniref:Protein MCM10 homolog n=1 Tax=Coccomyxa viridis TaxID=1274662 RepID=A0ABP1FLT3_9CHLO
MEVLLALANESEAPRNEATKGEVSHGLPYSLQDGDQDAFAALLELADQEDAEGSCASQNVTNEDPPSAGTQSTDEPDSTPQRSQKRQRSFRDSQENDSNASNVAQQAPRPLPAPKRQVAAFTSALARDQVGQMKNPVFPSVVLQERMSMLHFLRLPRAGDRANAGEAAGPWATIAVLTEKSRPRQSASGQTYSMWKVSDLAGVTVTVLLFGDAHQSLYRESEGAIMAICNARASAGGPGQGVSLKVSDPSSVYKLGTSADYALCGARTKKGETCRNPVNVSVCRFCDFHVQGEFKRLNSHRGPLITATVGARLGAHAKTVAKRQVKPEGPRYVPPMPDMQQLENAGASFNSQGARGSGQPVSMKHGGLASRPSSAQAGQQGRKQAAATLEGSASRLPGTRNEAVVMLEDAEVDWDVADIQKVQQRARNMTGHDRDEEDTRGMPAVPQPVSPTRMPVPVVTHMSAPLQTGQAQRADAMLKALQIVRSKGGVEAMTAKQNAARKHAGAALAAVRTSTAATISSATPGVTSGPEAHQQDPDSTSAAKPALEPKAFFSAQPSRPSGSSTQPSIATAGSRERLTAKLGLAPKSALGRRLPGASRPTAVICQPGQSAFAAAFGDALKDVDLKQTGTRYKAVIEDEEHERLDALLGTLQRKDEVQQRMEAITHLTVTAWRCATCNSTTDKRRPSCQGHEGKSVIVTKRWWTCAGCSHRFSTLGVKYPTKRCPNARCSAPESEFIKAGMAPSKSRCKDGPGEAAQASREDFKARGTEHSFCLK